MNHQHYAPEAFESDGKLKLSPSAEVVATLGRYGMTHPLLHEMGSFDSHEQKLGDIEMRMLKAQKLRTARIHDSVTGSSIEGMSFQDIYDTVYADASLLVALVGEKPPTLEDGPFLNRFLSLVESFITLDELELEPQFVLVPTHRTLAWWYNLGHTFERSLLNPTEPGPDNSKQTRQFVRGGGLNISESIVKEWANLTNCQPESSSWLLSVISKKSLSGASSCGYADPRNTVPSEKVNWFLKKCGKPLVKEREQHDPLTQLDIHPTIETYIMFQFTRALHGYDQPILDPLSKDRTYLDGVVGTYGNRAIVGRWNLDSGRVVLTSEMQNNWLNRAVIRPTIKGTTL